MTWIRRGEEAKRRRDEEAKRRRGDEAEAARELGRRSTDIGPDNNGHTVGEDAVVMTRGEWYKVARLTHAPQSSLLAKNPDASSKPGTMRMAVEGPAGDSEATEIHPRSVAGRSGQVFTVTAPSWSFGRCHTPYFIRPRHLTPLACPSRIIQGPWTHRGPVTSLFSDVCILSLFRACTPTPTATAIAAAITSSARCCSPPVSVPDRA